MAGRNKLAVEISRGKGMPRTARAWVRVMGGGSHEIDIELHQLETKNRDKQYGLGASKIASHRKSVETKTCTPYKTIPACVLTSCDA